MGCPQLKLQEDDSEDNLSKEALALIEHIGQLLAEEYIEAMKKPEGEEVKDESSDLRPVLK